MTAPVTAMTILSCTEDTLGGRRRTGARPSGTLPHSDHATSVNGDQCPAVQCIDTPVSMHVGYIM